ncbi:MBOAT family O-acyltransferase [Rhabdochromatium marinum]|uniref:MBOAT family O-acyltransferase n=1 Tax=Rhabdochromatium marinum TaxID=48729 RepID=UPI001903C184|nr:MBOAT family O-acyltransferase [Rhabdochromatium marinum]
MVFSSEIFLFFFLPLFLFVYFLVTGVSGKNIVLLFFSLFFYAWGEPLFVLMLLLSVTINWGLGRYVSNNTNTGKMVLVIGVAWNLLVLGMAKYADFFIENINRLPLISAALEPLGITLPLGVSFFTFQAISYLVDVYRGHTKDENSWIRVALYITMFPQLVAGPIVRYRTVASQLRNRRQTLARIAIGARIFIIGLAQKMLIANEVGRFADVAFADVTILDSIEAWGGLIAYTLQIYFDFAGYSNMAIGIGFIIGFSFPRNFRHPYTSQSVTEFWHRWHMSLSRWFRDYVYIPLGGNRVSAARTYLNLMAVFILCGFWHGAAWNFLIWGAYHGLFLILERAWLASRLQCLPGWLAHGYSLMVVMLGWVWFRAESPTDAVLYLGSLFGFGGNAYIDERFHEAAIPFWYLAMAIGILLSLFRWRPIRAYIASLAGVFTEKTAVQGAVATQSLENVLRDVVALTLLLASIVFVIGSEYNPFLYFRF